MKLPFLTCLLLAAPVLAAPQEIDETAERENGTWLNLVGQPPTVESLEGQSVLLLFFDTENVGGANFGQIRSFWYDFEGRGLVILGVYDGSVGAAEDMLRRYNLFFPIGIGTNFREHFGVPSGSHQILLDRRGGVFWSGALGGLWKGKLLKGMKQADQVKIERAPLRLWIEGDYKGGLKSTRQKAFDGKLANAIKDLQRLLGNERTKPDDRTKGEFMMRRVEAHVARLQRQIDAHVELGEARRVMKILPNLARELRPFEMGAWFQERLDELDEDEAFQEELAADKLFEEAYESFWRRGVTKIKSLLDRIVRDYPKTRAAQKARNLSQSR